MVVVTSSVMTATAPLAAVVAAVPHHRMADGAWLVLWLLLCPTIVWLDGAWLVLWLLLCPHHRMAGWCMVSAVVAAVSHHHMAGLCMGDALCGYSMVFRSRGVTSILPHDSVTGSCMVIVSNYAMVPAAG